MLSMPQERSRVEALQPGQRLYLRSSERLVGWGKLVDKGRSQGQGPNMVSHHHTSRSEDPLVVS
jgi:hypothetical protein